MNIIVCIKQVPDTEARIKVKEPGPGIVRENVKMAISPYDEFALEEALRIKEKQGGTVTVVTAGPDRAKEALRTALAVGADKAVHINDVALQGADELGIARALAAAIQKLDHDLVLFGKKAVGVDRGHVPAMVAQILGYPFVSQAFDIQVEEGKARVEREIEGGQETFELRLPAVVSREKSANELRHAALKGIMAAKSKPIQGFTVADLGVTDLKPLINAKAMAYPPERKAGRIIEGDAATAARELVRLLHEEARVI